MPISGGELRQVLNVPIKMLKRATVTWIPPPPPGAQKEREGAAMGPWTFVLQTQCKNKHTNYPPDPHCFKCLEIVKKMACHFSHCLVFLFLPPAGLKIAKTAALYITSGWSPTTSISSILKILMYIFSCFLHPDLPIINLHCSYGCY